MSPRIAAASLAKIRCRQSPEEARAHETAVHIRHAGLDELAKLELLAFADLDRA